MPACPYQGEEAQHSEAVVLPAAVAGAQLVQAIRQHHLGQLSGGLHADQEHAHTLVARCEDRLGEQHLPGGADAGQHPVEDLSGRWRGDRLESKSATDDPTSGWVTFHAISIIKRIIFFTSFTSAFLCGCCVICSHSGLQM